MFQFTSSLRSQTFSQKCFASKSNVSIHQLLAELDESILHRPTYPCRFNSLAPCGARQQTFTIIFSYITTFLSSFAKFQQVFSFLIQQEIPYSTVCLHFLGANPPGISCSLPIRTIYCFPIICFFLNILQLFVVSFYISSVASVYRGNTPLYTDANEIEYLVFQSLSQAFLKSQSPYRHYSNIIFVSPPYVLSEVYGTDISLLYSKFQTALLLEDPSNFLKFSEPSVIPAQFPHQKSLLA